MTAFERRLVRITNITALVAALWTSGCAAALVAGQVINWLQNGKWNAYALSSFVIGQRDITGTIASKLNTDRANDQILDWVLRVPAILPLLIAIIALIAFWRRLSKIERTDALELTQTRPES